MTFICETKVEAWSIFTTCIHYDHTDVYQKCNVIIIIIISNGYALATSYSKCNLGHSLSSPIISKGTWKKQNRNFSVLISLLVHVIHEVGCD
jgi:hypothetical protein